MRKQNEKQISGLQAELAQVKDWQRAALIGAYLDQAAKALAGKE